MSNKPPSKADVLQGTLDLMVLQTLDSLGPLHGYAIAARLEQVSSGALQLNMGTLYPALITRSRRRAGVSSLMKNTRGTGWRASSTRCCTARRESGRSHAHLSRMD